MFYKGADGLLNAFVGTSRWQHVVDIVGSLLGFFSASNGLQMQLGL